MSDYHRISCPGCSQLSCTGCGQLRPRASQPQEVDVRDSAAEVQHTQASGVEREIEHLRQQRDELLAALKAIVSNSMFEQRFDHCGFMNATALSDRDLFRKLWAKARDAIEKAEGRSDE